MNANLGIDRKCSATLMNSISKSPVIVVIYYYNYYCIIYYLLHVKLSLDPQLEAQVLTVKS